MRATLSDHQRSKQASQEAFEWCVYGIILTVVLGAVYGLLMGAFS